SQLRASASSLDSVYTLQMATAAPVPRLDVTAHALHCTKIVKDRTRVVHGRCYHDASARGCHAQVEGGAHQGSRSRSESSPMPMQMWMTTGRGLGRGSLASGDVVDCRAEIDLVREVP